MADQSDISNAVFDDALFRYYFLTVRTSKSRCFLGIVSNGSFSPSKYGKAVTERLSEFKGLHRGVAPMLTAVMPNHVHMLFRFEREQINELVTDENMRDIIRQTGILFRELTENDIMNNLLKQITPEESLWFSCSVIRGIRSQNELNNTIYHLLNNPSLWQEDRFYQRYISE